ncbi:hypothetical protein [Bradyrhizobium sp. ERR14]|uniref:hypothetical protein n=1 Tax=Bradyrhizobium sp. ERR14 TaxID=2663837 RepID=UPI00160CA15A|nr:hypothetical protein [Bradyrhizobium sp. ERR14]MBB4391477.1 chromosome segregation ATPase [Bradyrhizobium sp. ERR14]
MAPLKKPAATEPYRIPSLAEADNAYADLIVKRQSLDEQYGALNVKRAKLRREIEAAKAAGGKRLAPAVAELLGDATEGSIVELSRQLREVSTEMANIEAAIEILRRRTDEARNAASKLVCSAVMPEYRRRLGALCEAAKALEAARQSHDELLDQFDAEDVRKDYLRPVHPFFMGDRREGKVFYFLKEVKEAHNV